MSSEQEVVKRLQQYFKDKNYKFRVRKKTGKIKELFLDSKLGGGKVDFFAYKEKKQKNQFIFVECKGKGMRSISQGYGQILLYRVLFSKVNKKKLEEKMKKSGINTNKKEQMLFCFAFHQEALQKNSKVLRKLANNYSRLGIRTYIVGKKKIEVIRDKRLFD